MNLISKIKGREVAIIFLLTFVVHFAVVALIHPFDFQPIEVSDHGTYHEKSSIVAEHWRDGVFEIPRETVFVSNNYFYTIAGFYTLFGSNEFLGLIFFAVLMAALSAVFLYYLAREVGGSAKHSFWVSLIAANGYLSFLYHTSFFTKENVVIPASLLALLLGIRFMKRFSFAYFAYFSLAVLALSFVKLSVGTIIMLAFVFSALFVRTISINKRVLALFGFIFLLAFVPMSIGKGLFGIISYSSSLDPERIAYLRDTGYSEGANSAIGNKFISGGSELEEKKGFALYSQNMLTYTYSFINVLLGPFPWQMFKPVYLVMLLETIPWYVALYFIVIAFWYDFRKQRVALPIVLFALGLIAAIALISDNFGANTRFRISAFLALVALVPVGIPIVSNWLKSKE